MPAIVRPVRAHTRTRSSGSPLVNLFIFTRALDYLLIPGALAAVFLNYIAGAMAKLG
jgi:hypothetical protein